MTTTYKNPWHRKGHGPPKYRTESRPTKYRGHLIYQRIKGHVWDVVKDGACITQRAGMGGAKRAIDAITEAPP